MTLCLNFDSLLEWMAPAEVNHFVLSIYPWSEVLVEWLSSLLRDTYGNELNVFLRMRTFGLYYVTETWVCWD